MIICAIMHNEFNMVSVIRFNLNVHISKKKKKLFGSIDSGYVSDNDWRIFGFLSIIYIFYRNNEDNLPSNRYDYIDFIFEEGIMMRFFFLVSRWLIKLTSRHS